MKVPLRIPCCECGITEPVDIHLNDDSPAWVCSKGHHNQGMFALDFTVGYKILAKSEYELSARRDFSMSIVFSAMSFECELSRLFGKWTNIESNLANGIGIKDEEIEGRLRKMGVDQRIEAICRLMSPLGLNAFVSGTNDLKDAIVNRFPSLTIGSLATDFQQTVFWPRNRILHFGYTEYSEPDAARCYSIASIGLQILSQLDKAKYADVFPLQKA
jgi:hypothetical protein